MIPGEIMLKFISMATDGIEKDLLRVIWQVEFMAERTGREIGVVEET